MSNIDFTQVKTAEAKAAEAEAERLQADYDAAVAYLCETDWYVVRKTETAAAVPADIEQARAEARKRASDCKDALAALKAP